jgi:hypothetical protein
VQLSVLAHVTVPIIERYYLVIAVLLKSAAAASARTCSNRSAS